MRPSSKRLLVVLICVLAAFGGVYSYLRFGALKAKDFQPDARKGSSPLDLRPAVIAKLQQLVKDGSDGLYLLSIGHLDIDISTAEIEAREVTIGVDSAGYRSLGREKKLPNDVFVLRLDALRIKGLGADELLHTRSITIDDISFTKPQIEVFHQRQPYNMHAPGKEATMYGRLKKYVDRISIGKVQLDEGTYRDHNKRAGQAEVITQLKDVAIAMQDILIDSSTQAAPDRFLFAKRASLETKNFSHRTADSVYLFNIGKISVSAEQRKMLLQDVALTPRMSRDEFTRRQTTQAELYTVAVPQITMSGINWWKLFHLEEFIAEEALIEGGKASIYVDLRLPASGSTKLDNFPQQMLMDLETSVLLKKLGIGGLTISYDELNASSGQLGTISFDRITGQARNVTNLPVAAKLNPVTTFRGRCYFMNAVLMSGDFNFYLPKSRHGAFNGDVEFGRMDHKVLEPFAGPMGMVTLKSGRLRKGTAHVEGDNGLVRGNVTGDYSDLKIELLTKKGGRVKPDKVTGFIANALLVKNDNPGRFGKLRSPSFELRRSNEGNFFNFAWMGVMKGILKMVGIPPGLGM